MRESERERREREREHDDALGAETSKLQLQLDTRRASCAYKSHGLRGGGKDWHLFSAHVRGKEGERELEA